MTRRVLTVVGVCLAALLSASRARAADARVEYYKAGEVGAFAATVALPPDVDIGTATLSALPADGKAYLLYVALPVAMAERLDAVHRHRQPPMSPEQRAKAADIDRRSKDAWKDVSATYGTLQKARQRADGLKTILKQEEARKEGRDDALIARSRKSLADAEAEIKSVEARQKELFEQTTALDAEKRKLYEEARKGMRQVAHTLPVTVLGRFQGAGKTRVTLLARDPATLLAQPRPAASVDLELPAADGGNPDVLKRWALAQARDFTLRVADSPFSSYYQFCLLQSVRKYGVPEEAIPPALRREGQRVRRPDLYSMTTGALAIQESLQLDAMTGAERISDDRSVAVGSLKGPTIKSHPFEKMLERRTPKVFPMAALVPFDAYYCHFSSISKEIAASDLLRQWGTDLLRMLDVDARDSDLPTKCHGQLCIGVSVLTRMFGDLVIGDVAITGSDPFLREGTDLSVLIQVRNRPLFDQQMKGYVDAALAGHRDAAVAATTYQGVAIRSIATPDRRIASHSATLGTYAVTSNSLDALKRIIDTHAKRRRSMADNLDFQYMRTIFPGTPEVEDGFVYLSDPFIRKLVGPRWKIEAQRRILCQNHLRMIGNAATMFRTELRRPPTIEALVTDGYLPKDVLKCPDGGTYSLAPSGLAVCTVHNRIRYCTPVDSVPIEKVSREEAKDYREFVGNYNSYWRQYFDPIGIRFKVGDRVEVETCILPLIESSMYNQLRTIVGGTPVPLAARVLTPRTILAVAAKLDLTQPNYRAMIEGMQRALFPTLPPVTDAVGSSMAIGLCDSDVLFTVDERGLGAMGGWMGLEEQLVMATVLSAINLPVYGVVELRDEALARTIVRDLLRLGAASSRLEGRQPWEGFFGMDSYAAGEHNGHAVGALTLRLAVVRFRLYHAIAHKRLVVATKRYVLEEVLDALDKGQAAKPVVGNVRLDVRPRAYDKLLPVTTTGWMELMREACLRNLVPNQALIECHGATEETLGKVSRRVDGVTPRCPAGGTYKYDAPRGIAYCTVHGSRDHPRQPVEVTGQEELVRFLRRLRDVSVDFRFTDEGIMTRMALDLEPAKP